MPARAPSRQDDEQVLKILDLHYGEGMTAAQIGNRIGKTRSAVCGVLSRVSNAEVPCHCRKPENQDGGMNRKWWKTSKPRNPI